MRSLAKKTQATSGARDPRKLVSETDYGRGKLLDESAPEYLFAQVDICSEKDGGRNVEGDAIGFGSNLFG